MEVYSFNNVAIFNSSITIYIFYNAKRFYNYRIAITYNYVFIGDTTVQIIGYSNVNIRVNGPYGLRKLRLKNVTYYEGFICNLVSLR